MDANDCGIQFSDLEVCWSRIDQRLSRIVMSAGTITRNNDDNEIIIIMRYIINRA